MLAACTGHVVLVASVLYVVYIQSLMPNDHGKLHDWAARSNDKTVLLKSIFVSANAVAL